MYWLIPIVLLLSVLLSGMLGVYGMVQIAAAIRQRLRGGIAQKRQEKQIAEGQYPAWRQGEDLLRYPDRLSHLEDTLRQSLVAVEDQRAHLLGRRERVAAKEDRAALASRYDDDAALLARRAERVRRVLGLVWRTRTVLLLRAHVAVTARQRPVVQKLPEGELSGRQLDGAVETYEAGAERVRAFVATIEARTLDIGLLVTRPPPEALLEPGDEAAVAEELAGARVTYAELGRKMDGLSDTLAYLADRCRTRRVVEGASVAIDAEPGGEQLIDELNGALSALHDLAELGDQALADSALDSLTENIETLSRIEKQGLDAKAEADAAIEVGRLLQQFPRVEQR